MIKHILVEPDDLAVTPLVLAVAGFAFQGSGVFVFAVKALLVTDVVGYRFVIVTVKAQFILGGIAQANVAGGTLRGKFLVTLE